jgi:CHAD domain-containing protein
MPYRLQNDEPLASGLKRVAEEEVTAAIRDLESNKIYEVRKHLKKVRALLNLLGPQLGALAHEENRRLRDLARRFSPLRDLDVSLEVLESFASQYKRKNTLNPQRHALAAKQSAQLAALRFEAAESLPLLQSTRRRIEDWPLQALTSTLAYARLEKTHKESRRAFLQALQTRTVEDLHELRKSVKRELNQRRLFNAPEAHIRDLKDLSQFLGDHHNLAVLLDNLENSSGRFRRMAMRNLKLHETQILSLAARLYESQQQAASPEIPKLLIGAFEPSRKRPTAP